ncbi:MAG: MATE family efflux transporter [Clostridiales bacterium]|nr:MATE family efflux transporter [Clostridiales bacterium]
MKPLTMTSGSPWKSIIRFALPVLAGSLLQQLYNTVDAIIVGRYAGEASLSAVGTTTSFVFFFMAVAIGFSSGNGVVVAQHFGAGNEKGVRENASSGIVFLLVLGLISTGISIAVARLILVEVMHVKSSYMQLALQYFHIYALGFVFQYGYNIFAGILRAVGDSAATLYFLFIASIINIILDIIFVKNFRWGVAGAAFATDISQAVSFIAAYIYMTRRYPVFRFKLRDYKWRSKQIKQTVKIGFPISLHLALVSVGFTFIQRAVNEFGQAMTASFTVGQRMEMYLNLPCHALQTTMATYTGQNIGADRVDRVKKGLRQSVLISLVMTICIGIAVWILAPDISTLFNLSDKAEIYSISHIRTIALVNVILSMYIPLFGMFQGTNHPVIPMIAAAGALTVRVIITYLFRYSPFLGESVIWWNGLFGFTAGLIISWSYYFSGKWKKNAKIRGVSRNE